MTKQRYSQDCVAGSQVLGRAESPSDYAWIVNFNNGNSNNYNRNNKAFVRACRPSECHGDTSLRRLHDAWRRARRAKRPSANQYAFELFWFDRLAELQSHLRSGSWTPSPTTCFIAHRPKAREIHAPDFSDRVVHHWLVPQLDSVFESRFIFDSYSNRRGKGTHQAVHRLSQFVREVFSGEGGGYFLQLDIRNFFNSIHRPTLWGMLKRVLVEHGAPATVLRTTYALLRSSSASNARDLSTAQQRACLPPHKRLINAMPGHGIAIGNLSSQFFANVYLDALDQYVKHVLRAKRYLRYVDDFVIVHRDLDQLHRWRDAIAAFLQSELRLKLKNQGMIAPLTHGIDFLGYVVYPTHRCVRRRVVRQAFHKLRAWERRHVRRRYIAATPGDLANLQSVCASYVGHFRHGNAYRLERSLFERFRWLNSAMVNRSFSYELQHRVIRIPRFAK
jgi:RNA-directed DNA polymerase